jgi:ATP-dependent Zn protease
MTADIVRTAFHEAGHALLAFAVNHELGRVTIQRRGDRLGHVLSYTVKLARMPSIERYEKAVYHRMAVSLAGPLAEARLFQMAAPNRDNNDYDEARSNAALVTKAPGNLIAQCEIWTGSLLAAGWPQVKALADTLLIDRTIDGKRAEEILKTGRPMPRLRWRAADIRQLALPFAEALP